MANRKRAEASAEDREQLTLDRVLANDACNEGEVLVRYAVIAEVESLTTGERELRRLESSELEWWDTKGLHSAAIDLIDDGD